MLLESFVVVGGRCRLSAVFDGARGGAV